MKIAIILAALTVAAATASYTPISPRRAQPRRIPPPKSYLCPQNFVRTKHNKCYFFSRVAASFDQAYWDCHEKHATLAVIRGKNQDATLRRLLNKNKIDHVERWIGGKYNWEKMKWQWAASGKAVNYTGFENDVKEYKKWQCIVLDPKLEYRWNVRSCFEQKHYICQTRLKKTDTQIPNRQNGTKYDKNLNEVIIPEVTNNEIPANWAKSDAVQNDVGQSDFASRPNPMRKGKGGKRKGKGRKKKNKKVAKNQEGTQQDAPSFKKESDMVAPQKLKWMTYHGATAGPLLPRIIVENFDFQRNETSV